MACHVRPVGVCVMIVLAIDGPGLPVLSCGCMYLGLEPALPMLLVCAFDSAHVDRVVGVMTPHGVDGVHA